MDISKYPTAHQLAKDLLAGPDFPAVLAMPVFDMPGCMHALPVKQEVETNEGKQVVLLSVSREVMSQDALRQKHGADQGEGHQA
jgi:hypothetical protein